MLVNHLSAVGDVNDGAAVK